MDNNSIEKKKYSGLYIVSETGCLNPHTGASKHINAGLFQLKRHFNIELCLFCEPYMPVQNTNVIALKKGNFPALAFLRTIKSFLKWLYILFKNHVHFFSYLGKVKSASPDFIYERASYLNFNGLIIAKLLRIPHMFEVNGILSHGNSRYFPSILNKIAYWMERKSYLSSFGFYIGGINESINIPFDKSFIIQNGIDEKFVEVFKERSNFAADKINIVFIGHAMPHHRLDVLTDSLKLLSNPRTFQVHLIGSNLESLKDAIPDSVESFFYGPLNHDEISELIKSFHVGIITFALPYYSHVKAFMYGAAKLAMVVPDSRNFKNIFSDKEVLFIKNGSPSDLAEKLDYLAANPTMLTQYGENLHDKILNKFTWEKIYGEISCEIQNIIEKFNKK